LVVSIDSLPVLRANGTPERVRHHLTTDRQSGSLHRQHRDGDRVGDGERRLHGWRVAPGASL